MKKTKIIATIGPKTNNPEMLSKLIDVGCNVFRINMSHSDHEEAADIISKIRAISNQVGILLDTKGPEVRTTEVEAPIELKLGQIVTITGTPGITTATEIHVSYAGLPQVLNVGTTILIADGQIALDVNKIEPDHLICEVTRGNILDSKKGVNIPGIKLPMPFLSEQDASDIAFGVHEDVDFIAASFVNDASDIEEVKKLVKREGSSASIIAKIESRYALKNLEKIIEVSDGIMVARGDLGVEISAEEVPIYQKRIISSCRQVGKFVIVATEMLESMIKNQRPTRAETSDVANAIFEGADAVMLSGETSIGMHPIESVATIVRIAYIAEGEVTRLGFERTSTSVDSVSELICKGAFFAANELNVRAILVPSSTGRTAKIMSRYRPRVPILAITVDMAIARRLTLNYGIYALPGSHVGRMENMIRRSCQLMLDANMLSMEDLIAVVCGVPIGHTGSTNLLTLQKVSELMGRVDPDAESHKDSVS